MKFNLHPFKFVCICWMVHLENTFSIYNYKNIIVALVYVGVNKCFHVLCEKDSNQ